MPDDIFREGLIFQDDKDPCACKWGDGHNKRIQVWGPKKRNCTAYRIVEKMIAGLSLISYANEEGKRVDLVSPFLFSGHRK